MRLNDIILPIPTQEFDLDETLDCGQAFRWRKQEDGSYRGVVGGKLLHLSRMANKIILYDTTPEDYDRIWCDYFDMKRDYRVLKEQFSADPILCDAISYAEGIRVLKQEPWETLCTFIISANNNIPRIKGIVERMSTLFGTHLTEDYYSFPSPEQIAGLSLGDLAPLRCGYRDKFLLDAAHKVAGGEVSLSVVSEMSTDNARRELMKIKGIGPKVADCTLLFAFARSECFPMDTWMKKVMTILYPHGLPSDFLPNAGIAQQYLFHYARHHGELFADKKPEEITL